MAYIVCPECGQRALSVATRCPRCAHEFPAHPLRRSVRKSGLDNLRPGLIGAGAIIAVVVIFAVVRHQGDSSAVVVPPVTAPLNSLPPVPSQPALDTLASTGDSSRPDASARSVAPTQPAAWRPEGEQMERYATTWVNVRGEPSPGAPPVRVLRPGQAVLIDSLRKGWYRVSVDGRALGYVYSTYLDTIPSAVRP